MPMVVGRSSVSLRAAGCGHLRYSSLRSRQITSTLGTGQQLLRPPPPVHQRTKPSRRITCSVQQTAASAAAYVCSSQGLFALSTLYCLPLALLIACGPSSRRITRFLRSDRIFLPLALAYAVLLIRSWELDTLSLMMPGRLSEGFSGGRLQAQFIPRLAGIQKLFVRIPTAASLWVHLLTINIFAARWIMFDGLRRRCPTWHSSLLASVFGPLGIFFHFISLIFFGSRPDPTVDPSVPVRPRPPWPEGSSSSDEEGGTHTQGGTIGTQSGTMGTQAGY